jgi:DnaD/phage-associated family protein
MNKFKGFTDSETFSVIPDKFFHQLLKQIEDIAELKVTLYLIWRIEHMEGPFRALSKMNFDVKELGLAADEITAGLEKAVKRESLLKIQKDSAVYFLLNSPRGRAGVDAIKNGRWNPQDGVSISPAERPNIFKLYEENIGPLTPLIADMLKEAEELYREEWFEEAFTIAVKNNKRNWKYVEAILKRWKEEGTHGQKNQQSSEKSSERYTDGQFSEFLKRD